MKRQDADIIARVEQAIDAVRNGKMVILVDDEDRENEGDLVMAAELVTPAAINFMATYGRGLICLSLTQEKADALDLPFATFRFRPEGGAGGQRGVRSIIQHLGDGQFARLRIGIDRPPGRMDPAAYVLQDFSKAEEKELALRREEAVDGIELWMTDGIVAAMNRYN